MEMLRHRIARLILSGLGWTIDVKMPVEKKFVLIGAPHTSNWDFPLALLVFWTLDIRIYWVAKIQLFRWPLGPLFRRLGGIPVDRSRSTGFIEQIRERFDHADQMALAISPEGTRSRVEHWKSGFYHIAMSAGVPIVLAYIDYPKKRLGFSEILTPSGDIDSDMRLIAEYYRDIDGLYTEKKGPIRIKPR